LVEIAIEPRAPRARREVESRLREYSDEGGLDVPAKIRRVIGGRKCFKSELREPVEDGYLRDTIMQLALGQPEHVQTDHPPRPRPRLCFEVRTN